MLVACKNGRVVGASRIEYVHTLHLIARAFLLPCGCFLCRNESVLCQNVVGHRVEHNLKLLFRLTVLSVFQQLAGVSQLVLRRGLLVAYGIGIGSCSLLRGVDALVAQRHLQCYLSTLGAFLRRSLGVSLFELVGSVVVFAYGKILLATLHVLVGSASRQHKSHDCYAGCHGNGGVSG